jgi:hypothetical protein
MPAAAQHTNIYAEYLATVAETEAQKVEYYAVSIVGRESGSTRSSESSNCCRRTWSVVSGWPVQKQRAHATVLLGLRDDDRDRTGPLVGRHRTPRRPQRTAATTTSALAPPRGRRGRNAGSGRSRADRGAEYRPRPGPQVRAGAPGRGAVDEQSTVAVEGRGGMVGVMPRVQRTARVKDRAEGPEDHRRCPVDGSTGSTRLGAANGESSDPGGTGDAGPCPGPAATSRVGPVLLPNEGRSCT